MPHRIARSLLAVAMGLMGPALAQDTAPGEAPGWTGITHPQDVVTARQALMFEVQRLMKPIDSYSAGVATDTVELRANAGMIATMLLAVPHLFPPTTDLYDADSESPATLALPAVWQSFETFYELSSAASAAATEMASMTDESDLRQAATDLRAACDACHAVYLRTYVPPEATSEDTEFDFDSVFPED